MTRPTSNGTTTPSPRSRMPRRRLVVMNREELLSIMRRMGFDQDDRTIEETYGSIPEAWRQFSRLVFQSGEIHDEIDGHDPSIEHIGPLPWFS